MRRSTRFAGYDVVTPALVIAMLLVAGCHSPIGISHSESGLLANGEFTVVRGIDLPKVTGVKGCGAQALAAVIAFVDEAVDAEALARELPWHREGATPVELLVEARLRGCEARISRGSWRDLADSLRAGQPVVVMIDAGYEVRWFFARYDLPRVMHWAVVSGMAADGRNLLLAAENGRHHKVEREDFERRWARSDDCAIVIRASSTEE